MDYENQKIIPVEINKEMRKSFIDYAMSVIAARALPDVRDGLKPVHRRILYTMYEDGLYPNKGYRKSATTVGDVLGRYHPHGDASVYDALVRLAQDFSLRYTLVDGHGNFGSVDGDPPAAYRYTEARMSKMSMEMLRDIENETVDYVPNYDDRLKEPEVLPSRFPNLLVNGSSVIAVGMATNIPPHNLGEIIDAIFYLIESPDCYIEDLMEIVKGPDFPTGGLIMGRMGIRDAYTKGRGRIIMRAKAEIEEMKGDRFRIVVTEIPYQVNKARLIESIANHVKDKRIVGISDIRDESDREGMRIVIELKRDANPQVILNQLYKLTQMQETFAANMLALVNYRPVTLNLKEMLQYYIEFQEEIITRRTQHELRKAKDRAHILEGLTIAIDNIDEVIKLIRANPNIPAAKQALIDRFELSDIQSQAIVDMRLGRLTGLERDKILEEYHALLEKIKELEAILGSEEKIFAILREELQEIKEKYADPRRTSIEPVADDIDLEDLIEEEQCIITRTHFGYIKRQPVNTYKAQHRGGRGIAAMSTREEDFVEELFVASTHDYILFFTTKGRVYRLKGYMIPEESRVAKGANLVNLIQIEQDEKITAVIPVHEFDEEHYLTMITRDGTIKRTALSEYDTNRKGGLIAILLDEGDLLEQVKLTDGKQAIVLGTRNGRAIRFMESDVRPMGRVAHGVRGMLLGQGDYIVGMCITRGDAKLLTVTENGYGKRTDVDEYKIQQRGGKGITNYNLTDKTGLVAGIKIVDEQDDVMLIASDGTIIRTGAEEIPVYSRATMGVRVMKVPQDARLVTLARTQKEDESEEGDEAEPTQLDQ